MTTGLTRISSPPRQELLKGIEAVLPESGYAQRVIAQGILGVGELRIDWVGVDARGDVWLTLLGDSVGSTELLGCPRS